MAPREALPRHMDDSRSPEQAGPRERSRAWELRQRGEQGQGMLPVWLLVLDMVGAPLLVRGGPQSSPVHCCTRDMKSRSWENYRRKRYKKAGCVGLLKQKKNILFKVLNIIHKIIFIKKLILL